MMEGKAWLCVKEGLNALDVDLDFSHIPFYWDEAGKHEGDSVIWGVGEELAFIP